MKPSKKRGHDCACTIGGQQRLWKLVDSFCNCRNIFPFHCCLSMSPLQKVLETALHSTAPTLTPKQVIWLQELSFWVGRKNTPQLSQKAMGTSATFLRWWTGPNPLENATIYLLQLECKSENSTVFSTASKAWNSDWKQARARLYCWCTHHWAGSAQAQTRNCS